MKPILKYAGGKTNLLSQLLPLIESVLLPDATYWEPFVGGGAVTFALQHPRTAINDLNVELMNLYNVIADESYKLLAQLRLHQEEHCKEHYYEVRAWDRSSDFWNLPPDVIAGRTVYLNKTCFNGLFRVNSKGYFNTPIGRTTSGKTPDIVQEKEILELSEFLKHCDRHTGHYDEWLLNADIRPRDVIFMDPPYDPGEEIHTSGYTSYQKEGWTRDDLVRLKAVADVMVERGANVILTNNSTEFVRDLFKHWYQKEVPVKHSINCKGDNRQAKEIIISSVPFPC